MSDSDPELRRRLASLADRTTPRGPGAVLAGARAQAGSSRTTRRPGLALMAVAACLVLVATTVALVSSNHGGKGQPVQSAAGAGSGGPTSTTPSTIAGVGEPGGPTTSTPAATTPTAAGSKPKAGATPTTTKGRTTTTVPLSDDQARARLASFSTCPALVDYAKTEALKVVGPYGLPNTGAVVPTGGISNVRSPASDSASPAPAASGTTGTNFSTTNNQEADVDEPDTVKTDGKRIFALANGKLWATAVDGAPRVVGSLAFDGIYPSQLLLAGDRLLVFGYGNVSTQGSDQAKPTGSSPVAPGSVQSRVVVVDVGDAAAMKVVTTLNVDGSYLSARLVKGVARIVLRTEPARFTWSYPKDGSAQAQQEATDKNKAIVSGSTTANWVPTLTVTDGAGRTGPAKPLADCSDSLHPQVFSGFGMLTVLTVDPDSPTATNATSVMASGNIVYASTTGLYVSTTAWDHVENQGQVVRFGPDTLVHKFDITSTDGAVYKASGRVQGTALNQYSMSELDGRLRIATTASNPNSTESYVTVLADNGAALVSVGQVGGLGKGERIYSVRFVGDTAYVVTFRQTDPLYVVDLSDPTKPRVAGELQLLGYSAYLHPIGDNLLLGIGQDANAQGRTTGVQASVFDVSDPSQPKLLQRQNFGQGSSSAAFDPHAFLWWAPTKLAMLPTQLYGSNGPTFIGAIGITASTGGMGEVGRVKHPEVTQNGNKYTPVIERSLVIGDSLYTMSQAGLLSSDLKALTDRAWVPFS